LATQGVVIPNAVGVDIGCGMCAVKTSLTGVETETIKKILGEIRKAVPVGFNHQKEAQNADLMPKDDGLIGAKICDEQWKNALTQIGTLGGGNHFIEIQKGSDNHIWIMIHSGSRNFGLKVAGYYNKLAQELNAKWHTVVDPKWELAFLPLDSNEGQAYLKEMQYAVDFALANRELMMHRIVEIFIDQIKPLNNWTVDFYGVDMINIAHNYARMEHHNGKDVMIHRKGATLASDQTTGIIPGSQGTASYIVKGKGNPESYNSCSHGAGRKMSRTAAIRDLDLEDEVKKLDDKGVLHAIRGKKELDEAPGAYKDIDVVMSEQEDLVEILVKLEPLAVVKG
jgi:tRNA-splicing ligase RtcB (3'-phosphate/5'-hydroxy nucleic acid ligase)